MSKQVRQYALVTMIAIVSLWIAPFANAQEIRDYAITDVRSELIEDDTVIRLTVVVENIGADAVGETDILIMAQEASDLDAESRELLSDNLLPLDSGTSVTLEIP
ncbi:MAG: hypothetical protein AAFQ52_06625, partial [Chloroflexota bacterium]